MPCNLPLLGALADGALRGFSAWRVRRHVADCTSCQQELSELEALRATLKSCSPLPNRKPIHRPLGIIRPAVATLALASVSAFLVARIPVSETLPMKPGPESPRLILPPAKRVESAPSFLSVASTQRRRRTPRKRVVRRVARQKAKTSRRTVSVAKSVPRQPTVQETEQVIIVASEIIPPKPVTVVLYDHDDEGGTIHIESTIPAAYLVALQKETN
jgi:hypothetical protein